MIRHYYTPIVLFVLSLFIVPSFATAETPKDFDVVSMKSGTIVEGCVSVETKMLVTIDTIGGSLSVPMNDVKKIDRSRPGESQLMLGLQLLERKKLDRAERLLKKASVHTNWRDASKKGLDRLEEIRVQLAEEQRENEQNRIENLIRRKGLQAGIDELERRYTQDDPDEYWGSMRGNLHLMMARERIDHLDLREAERHLVMAEKYGVDKEQWETVRNELLSTRRESVLIGPSKLASRRMEKKKKRSSLDFSSNLLAAVQQAQKRGEKTPPMQWVRTMDRYAQLHGLDPLLIWAIIDTESSWRKDAVSPVGAQGLMQLMPPTAKELDIANPFNPEENIRGGISYMRFLIEMFKDVDTALAAYNVGPGRVERTGIPPAGKRYIKKIRTRLAALKERFGSALASS